MFALIDLRAQPQRDSYKILHIGLGLSRKLCGYFVWSVLNTNFAICDYR